MLIFRLFSVIALILLSGCANQQKKEIVPKETLAPVKLSEPDEKTEVGEIPTSIDPDVLFILLSAEIAGQRGHYDIAYQGYMEAARRVRDPKPAERAAMIAMYMKDNNKLKRSLEIWLAHDPENLTARKLAVLTALRARDKNASNDHLDAMLAEDPAGFEKMVLELVEMLQEEGKVPFLYDALDAVSVKHPDQSLVFYVQSLLAVQMKKKDAAEYKIKQALMIQPDWDKALIFQAQIAIFSGDMEKAEALLRNASTKYPENEKINKIFAQVLIKRGDYEGAGEVYQKMIANDPDDIETQFALGLVYFQLDRDDKSEEVLTKLLEYPKWRNQASFYLGKLEEKHGNVEKAAAWFDKVTEGPFEFEAPLSAVAVLLKDKQYDEVSSRLKAMEIRFPKQAVRIRLLQAEMLSQQKKYEEAFKLLTDSLIQYPDDKNLLYTRALMAERMGKVDILESDLKKVLAKNPESAEALNALGYSLLNYPDRYDEAETYLIKALRLEPDEPVIMDSYGWLQFKLGNPAKALIFLEQAYSKQQENEIAAHLAEVLWVLGRKDEARKLINKALRKAPEDEYLLDFQRRFLNGE
ncbi:MAG: tetratricopeptide repeat protein [Gammaproteobacteria bacterium]